MMQEQGLSFYYAGHIHDEECIFWFLKDGHFRVRLQSDGYPNPMNAGEITKLAPDSLMLDFHEDQFLTWLREKFRPNLVLYPIVKESAAIEWIAWATSLPSDKWEKHAKTYYYFEPNLKI